MTKEQQELDFEVGGQRLRTKGYRLVDLIWLPMVLGIAYIVVSLNYHDAAAQARSQASATASRSSDIELIAAIKELTAEQRKSTIALREMACLLDPAMRNRSDSREFCKRIAYNER